MLREFLNFGLSLGRLRMTPSHSGKGVGRLAVGTVLLPPACPCSPGATPAPAGQPEVYMPAQLCLLRKLPALVSSSVTQVSSIALLTSQDSSEMGRKSKCKNKTKIRPAQERGVGVGLIVSKL